MMGEKIEAVEVNILSDNDKTQKKSSNTNGVDHAAALRLTSITDDQSTSDNQPSDKDQSANNKNCNIMGFYKHVNNLFFSQMKKKAERQQRIQKILVSINSIEADLNNIPDGGQKNRCYKEFFEIAILILAILTVVGIFLIPVILYYTGPPIPKTDESVAQFFKTCTPDCRNYTEDSKVCQSDAMNPYSTIPGYFADDLNEAEKKLSEIRDIVSRCSDNNTKKSAMSFFCKAGYRTCSTNLNLFPTYKECELLRHGTCSEQWTELQTVSSTVTCCNGYNRSFTCPNQFDKFCNTCAPVCHEFSQHGEATTIGINVINAIAMIGGNFIVGIIAFVSAFLKRKTMFHFPNVLVLYFIGVYFINGLFVVTPVFWRKDLLCSDKNLFIATVESTTFCQVQGFILDASILMYSQFWLLFVFHLFMKVVDPLKTWCINKSEYSRRIHIIEVIGVLCLGLITPITTLAATDGYHIGDFPPNQCYSDSTVFFHGIILPNITMCVIGICLILVTLFHIHRTTGIFKRVENKRSFSLSVPEIKLMIISFYLTIVLGISTLQFTLNVRNLNDLLNGIMEYSQCVASGNCNCEDKREMIERASLPETVFLFFIAIMFLNCSNLFFIIQLKDVKHMARRATRIHRTFTSTDAN